MKVILMNENGMSNILIIDQIPSKGDKVPFLVNGGYILATVESVCWLPHIVFEQLRGDYYDAALTVDF